jgi:hypothetical protein
MLGRRGSLPAAATTTTPLVTSNSAASSMALSRNDCGVLPPGDVDDLDPQPTAVLEDPVEGPHDVLGQDASVAADGHQHHLRFAGDPR